MNDNIYMGILFLSVFGIVICLYYISRIVFAYAKTKAQISFAVTAKLISTFVFTTGIVHSLFFSYPKFQASSYFLRLYRPVCVDLVGTPEARFCRVAAHILMLLSTILVMYSFLGIYEYMYI